MYCSKCGAQINDAAIICPACGVPTQNYQQNAQPQQPPVINVVNTNTNVNNNTANAIGFGKAKKQMGCCMPLLFLRRIRSTQIL